MPACRSITLLALALASAGAAEALPPIVVTGTKVTTEIGAVPASVAVTSGQEIEDRGDRTLDDLAEHTANVGAINLGGHTSYPVIRGISGLADDGPAAILIDGIAPRGLGFDSLLDVDQVEILRGPQGTLYGRNSLPGVVVVRTRDPGRVWDGMAQVDASTFNTQVGTAAIGGPLSDDVGVRLAVRGKRSDGWRTNTLTDDDQAAEVRDLQGQGKLVYAIGHGWTAKLGGQAASFVTTGDQYAPLKLAADNQTSNSDPGEFSSHLQSGGLTLEQASGDRVFTAITGTTLSRDVFDLDIDFSALPGNTLHKETYCRQLSQEVRYSGGTGLGAWVVGLYGARDGKDVDYLNQLGPALGGPVAIASRGLQTTNDLAAFGEAGLPLGPGWFLRLGLRADYTRITVDLDQTINQSPSFSYEDHQQATELLPKGALCYSWSDDVLSWLSATRGYQAGGYNLTPNSQVEIQGGYDPETAWTYELGQRVTALDRTLRVSVAGFYTAYHDKQVSVLEPPSTYLIRNAAEATIIGAETDVAAQLAPGIDLLTGGGVLRATFDDYQVDPATDLSGKHLPMAPSYDAYIGLQWRGASGLVARVDLSALGSCYGDDRNQVEQDAYQLLSARVGYEAETWAVYLWGRNLGDSGYVTRSAVSPIAGAVAVSGEPRTVGVSAAARF
jgi:iron complex outermembrane receptor protein